MAEKIEVIVGSLDGITIPGKELIEVVISFGNFYKKEKALDEAIIRLFNILTTLKKENFRKCEPFFVSKGMFSLKKGDNFIAGCSYYTTPQEGISVYESKIQLKGDKETIKYLSEKFPDYKIKKIIKEMNLK